MKYIGFEISNFKGIKKVKLDLNSNQTSKISILVGLNESGKTTIMEALSFFYENLNNNLNESQNEIQKKPILNINSLIPKNRKDNFSDSIKIKTRICIDDASKEIIKNLLKDNNFIVTEFDSVMEITKEFLFENSSYASDKILLKISIKGKNSKGRKILILGPETNKLAWIKAWNLTRKLLPKIIYYPDFLFDFPDKLFLEESQNEGKEQKFYRKIVQDILDSLNRDLKLDKHIIERAKSNDPDEEDALESVINKMGSKITEIVFNDKVSIFQSENKSRSITVAHPKIEASKNLLYIELKLKEGEDSFYIRERSLGFQWFFTFMLFTQFRVHRLEEKENVIFLLDEPASNLHQTSQQKLLKAFEEITKSQVSVIYSTHSHHLINTKWLENTFIVKNEAIKYNNNEDNYDLRATDIKVEKYRSFVGSYPHQTTYFQPILDVLDYRPSNLENIPDVVMIEGKNDFYTISYFQEVILSNKTKINLLPGSGSGSLDNVIQLYYAWGRNFIVLLDGDTEGTHQKKRYIDKFGIIVEDKIFTFKDINELWLGKGMEKIIGEEDNLRIIKTVYPETKRNEKKKLNRVIQENLVNKTISEVSEETKRNFMNIFLFFELKLNS